MRATVIHGLLDIRVAEVPDPVPTDAVVRVTHACICDSDVRAYPSPVVDLTGGLDGVPGGYAAMHDRSALKVLVRP